MKIDVQQCRAFFYPRAHAQPILRMQPRSVTCVPGLKLPPADAANWMCHGVLRLLDESGKIDPVTIGGLEDG